MVCGPRSSASTSPSRSSWRAWAQVGAGCTRRRLRLGGNEQRHVRPPAVGRPCSASPPGLPAAAADIVCLQETKLRRCDIDRELAVVEGWCVPASPFACGCLRCHRAATTFPPPLLPGCLCCRAAAAMPLLSCRAAPPDQTDPLLVNCIRATPPSPSPEQGLLLLLRHHAGHRLQRHGDVRAQRRGAALWRGRGIHGLRPAGRGCAACWCWGCCCLLPLLPAAAAAAPTAGARVVRLAGDGIPAGLATAACVRTTAGNGAAAAAGACPHPALREHFSGEELAVGAAAPLLPVELASAACVACSADRGLAGLAAGLPAAGCELDRYRGISTQTTEEITARMATAWLRCMAAGDGCRGAGAGDRPWRLCAVQPLW